MLKRIRLTISRQPREGSSSWSAYELEVDDDWSVLNALRFVRDWIDPSLAFYGVCGRGVCDGCWILVDGEAALACTTPMDRDIRIDPIPGHECLRDLFVRVGERFVD